MYHLKLHAETVAWSPLDFPGVSLRVLHTDPNTGAMSVLTRMAPGATIPAHLHTREDETVYVLEGDFVEGPRCRRWWWLPFPGSVVQRHGPGAISPDRPLRLLPPRCVQQDSVRREIAGE
jgi:hypothetical protein